MSKKKILKGLSEQIANANIELAEAELDALHDVGFKAVAVNTIRKRLKRLVEIRDELQGLLL